MEVLTNLKDLLHSRIPLSSSEKSNTTLNYDAGAEILSHFQNQWQELHEINESNAASASKLAENIDALHTYVVTQNESIGKINQYLTATPNIKHNIDNCAKQINHLHDSFETVEKALIRLEDVIERCELEQMKHDHRYQLALYKEKKLASLESARSDFSTKHARNIIEFELKQKKALKERQQVFQEAFNSDLETYKVMGAIPKIEVVKTQPSALLEEIQLDIDDKELNDFLNDN